MLPSEFDSITQQIVSRFKELLAADVDGARFPELLTMEETVLAFVRDLGCSMMQAFADVRVEQTLALRAPCECGLRMEALQRRRWTCDTLVGPICIADPYLYCRTCHASEHPLHAWLGTERQRWSLLVQEATVDLASDESCEKAVAKLARHHPGVDVGRTTALRMLHHHGAEARVFIQGKLDTATARTAAGTPPVPPATELEVEYDAGMIPVATMERIPVLPGQEPKRTPVRDILVRKRAARWEEAKVSVVQVPGKNERLYAMRPTGGVDAAFEDMGGLAALLGRTAATQVRGIADGAVYIRPRMEAVFKDGTFKFILDRPHCKEHLTAAGVEMALRTGVPALQWAETALKKMEGGRASEVVDELQDAYIASGPTPKTRNDALRLAAGYFRRNQDAVAYAEYRANGWGTASSEVESGHRHTVQVRMKIAGAWWHPSGVDDILALRMLKANGWWADYWAHKRQQWRTHAADLANRSTAA